jgi:hypothetical protein
MVFLRGAFQIDGVDDDEFDPALEDKESPTDSSGEPALDAKFDALLAPGLWRDFGTHLARVLTLCLRLRALLGSIIGAVSPDCGRASLRRERSISYVT